MAGRVAIPQFGVSTEFAIGHLQRLTIGMVFASDFVSTSNIPRRSEDDSGNLYAMMQKAMFPRPREDSMANERRDFSPPPPPDTPSSITASEITSPPFDPALLPEQFISDAWWRGESPRLEGFAAFQIGRHIWRNHSGEAPGGAPQAADYVQRAAEAILSGRRRYRKGVPPIAFVFMVIHSFVTNDAQLIENRQDHRFLTSAPEKGVEIDESLIPDRIDVPNPEELYAAQELVDEFVRGLPLEYRMYVEILISGLYPTAEDRARRLGVQVSKIRNMDKVIRRMRSTWKGSPPPKKEKKEDR
jgi:hypothetical protein